MGKIEKNLRELAERLFVVDEKAGIYLALRQKLQRTANMRGCVVEAGFTGDLGIVKKSCIQTNFSTRGTTAEEIDRATFANELGGEFPRLGLADGFDDNVGAAATGVALEFGEQVLAVAD